MAHTPRPGRAETVAVLLLLLLGSVLRLGWPGLTEFKADEARLLALALDMAQGGGVALRGISSSVGLPNFPMSVWLYAIPAAVWPHPLAATLFTGALNVAALAGTWWLARRAFGRDAALIALLLFTVNPWALHHARKIWAQNLLAPFVTGWALAGWLAYVDGRSRWLAAHWLCLAVAVQTHLAAISLVPVSLAWLLLLRRRQPWRAHLVGLALGAATALPFAVYVARNGLPPSGASGAPGVSGLALRYAWLLFTGREIHALAGADQFRTYLTTVPPAGWVHALWTVLLLLGVARLLRPAPGTDPATRRAGWLMLSWPAAAVGVFFIELAPPALHYVLPIYPAVFVVAGVGGAWVLARLGRRRWLGWAALGATAVVQVWVWGGLLAFVATQATPGGFGVPLTRLLTAADAARGLAAEMADSAESRAEILIVGTGEFPLLDNEPAVYDVLLRDVPHRFVDARRSAVFPAGPAVVLLTESSFGDHAAVLRDAATDVVDVAYRTGEAGVTVVQLPPQPPTPDTAFDPPLLLANWVNFVGYDAPERVDGAVRWALTWRTGTPAPVAYHFFAHLLDGERRLVGQEDRPAFAATQWREGDTVVSVFRVPDSAESTPPYTVRSGMYVYPELTHVPLLDVAANPYADAVEVPVAP